MVILRDEKDRAPADHASGDRVAQEAFLHDQYARGTGAAHKLVPGEENRVLRDQSLNRWCCS